VKTSAPPPQPDANKGGPAAARDEEQVDKEQREADAQREDMTVTPRATTDGAAPASAAAVLAGTVARVASEGPILEWDNPPTERHVSGALAATVRLFSCHHW
jgi:hypothetical protein